jgi:predicted nucleotidyltransferase
MKGDQEPLQGIAVAGAASAPTGSFTLHEIVFDDRAIRELCRRYHISKLMIYGSILRNDFHPESDIDMLVEFEPGHTLGWEFIDIQDELAELLGREVDLGTPKGLSKYIKDRVMSEAAAVYVY